MIGTMAAGLQSRPAVVNLPRWSVCSVVCIASGPSLTTDQVAQVLAWRSAARDRRVIVINTTFRLAPWADVLYACDARWWKTHIAEVRAKDVSSSLWSTETESAKYGANIIPSAKGRGLSRTPGLIHQGSNSGFQVINFAWQADASSIVLLGYDMRDTGGRTHWHGDHPPGLARANPYADWMEQMEPLAADLRADGVPVINATPGTALRCFPTASLEEALS